jgi:hypothetical protein
MRLISAMTSSLSGGLPGLFSDLDLRLQTLRNSSRCQRSTVSGWTMWKACFQVRSLEASKTKSARSLCVPIEYGRLLAQQSVLER